MIIERIVFIYAVVNSCAICYCFVLLLFIYLLGGGGGVGRRRERGEKLNNGEQIVLAIG